MKGFWKPDISWSSLGSIWLPVSEVKYLWNQQCSPLLLDHSGSILLRNLLFIRLLDFSNFYFRNYLYQDSSAANSSMWTLLFEQSKGFLYKIKVEYDLIFALIWYHMINDENLYDTNMYMMTYIHKNRSWYTYWLWLFNVVWVILADQTYANSL